MPPPLDRARQQLVGARRPTRPGFGKPDAGRDHANTNGFRDLAGTALKIDCPCARHRHDQVEAVEQRARELVAVAGEPLRRTGTLRAGVSTSTARTQIHRSDQLKPRREANAPDSAGDDQLAVLQRLAQGLQGSALEFRQLVQQQDAAMCEAGLAGA